MPLWASDLFWFATAIQGLGALSGSVWKRDELEPTSFVDWGPQPNRIREATISILIALYSLITGFQMGITGAASWIQALGCAIFMSCMGLCVAFDAFSHLGLYESGMRVSTRFFFGTSASFIEWSTIKQYQWTEQGTLLINPGWHQTTCLVPDDIVSDVVAVLKAKCLKCECPSTRVKS